MHELLLFGQVPYTRHDQVLKILAGIAAMQPQSITERHLIFKPTRTPGINGTRVAAKPGTSNSQVQALQAQMQGDLFYVQLVSDLKTKPLTSFEEPPFISEDTDMNGTQAEHKENKNVNGISESQNPTASAQHITELSKNSWSLEFRDLPEVPGRRPVTSRLMASVPIDSGDVLEFLESLGYVFKSEYVLRGYQFVHKNIVLLLHRPLLVPSHPPEGLDEGRSEAPKPIDQISSPEKLRPLDPSNGFVLQASIRVLDGTKPETMAIAMNELKAFKDMMKGVVEMEIGDRLALDTRVK